MTLLPEHPYVIAVVTRPDGKLDAALYKGYDVCSGEGYPCLSMIHTSFQRFLPDDLDARLLRLFINPSPKDLPGCQVTQTPTD